MNNTFYPCIYDVTHLFGELSLRSLTSLGAPEKVEIRGAMLAFLWNVKTPMGDGSDADDLIEITLVYDPGTPDDWSLDFYSHETLEEHGVDPIKLEEINDVIAYLINCNSTTTPITINMIQAYFREFVN